LIHKQVAHNDPAIEVKVLKPGVVASGFLDDDWSYTSGGRWGTHLGFPWVMGVIKTRRAMACSFLQAQATTIGGDSTLVSWAMMAVKLREAAPDDELMQVAV
jgi:hypothetical protein